MTTHGFDAPASITQPRSRWQHATVGRTIRVAWLLARAVRRQPVRYEDYRRRFGRSATWYRDDMSMLRALGIRRASSLVKR